MLLLLLLLLPLLVLGLLHALGCFSAKQGRTCRCPFPADTNMFAAGSVVTSHGAALHWC